MRGNRRAPSQEGEYEREEQRNLCIGLTKSCGRRVLDGRPYAQRLGHRARDPARRAGPGPSAGSTLSAGARPLSAGARAPRPPGKGARAFPRGQIFGGGGGARGGGGAEGVGGVLFVPKGGGAPRG